MLEDSGEHLVEVEAEDAAGNVSDRAAATVRIDRIEPETTVTGLPAEPGSGPVTLAFSATDAHSGVATTEVKVGDGEWTVLGAEPVVVTQVGTTTVSYRSTDAAGNVETIRDVLVEITAPEPTEPPSITLATGMVAAGGSLAILGAGFRPGEVVHVSLDSGQVELGALRADQAGRVEGVVIVPATAKTGKHRIELTGEDSGRSAEAKLTVSGGPRPR